MGIVFDDKSQRIEYEAGWNEWLSGSEWEAITTSAEERLAKALQWAAQ